MRARNAYARGRFCFTPFGGVASPNGESEKTGERRRKSLRRFVSGSLLFRPVLRVHFDPRGVSVRGVGRSGGVGMGNHLVDGGGEHRSERCIESRRGRALFVENAEGTHGREQATEQDRELHQRNGSAECAVEPTEMQTAQRAGEQIGHETQHNGDEDPQQREGNERGEHLRTAARDAQVTAERGIAGGGDEQAHEVTHRRADFAHQTGAPTGEQTPGDDEKNKEIEHRMKGIEKLITEKMGRAVR